MFNKNSAFGQDGGQDRRDQEGQEQFADIHDVRRELKTLRQKTQSAQEQSQFDRRHSMVDVSELETIRWELEDALTQFRQSSHPAQQYIDRAYEVLGRLLP